MTSRSDVSPWSDMQLLVGWLVLAATPEIWRLPDGRQFKLVLRRISLLCHAIGDRADEAARDAAEAEIQRRMDDRVAVL